MKNEDYPLFDQRLTFEQICALLRETDREYWNQNHDYRNLEAFCSGLLGIPLKYMELLGYGWLKVCERACFHHYFNVMRDDALTFDDDLVIEQTTIGEVFDKGFINMLRALLNTRWHSRYDKPRNQITINGKDINTLKDGFQDPVLSSREISIKKILLNIYLSLFIKNSLDEGAYGGHKMYGPVKVDIQISEDTIRISDGLINGKDKFDAEYIDRRKQRFEATRKEILAREGKFRRKTLKVFSSIVKYANGDYRSKQAYEFSFGINDDGGFSIELKFNLKS